MPAGKGTYGNKRGRPPKKARKKPTKSAAASVTGGINKVADTPQLANLEAFSKGAAIKKSAKKFAKKAAKKAKTKKR